MAGAPRGSIRFYKLVAIAPMLPSLVLPPGPYASQPAASKTPRKFPVEGQGWHELLV